MKSICICWNDNLCKKKGIVHPTPIIIRITGNNGMKAVCQYSSERWIFFCVCVTFRQVRLSLQRCSWTRWSGSFPHLISSFISGLLWCFFSSGWILLLSLSHCLDLSFSLPLYPLDYFALLAVCLSGYLSLPLPPSKHACFFILKFLAATPDWVENRQQDCVVCIVSGYSCCSMQWFTHTPGFSIRHCRC